MELCAGLKDVYGILRASWDLGLSVYDLHNNVGFFSELQRYYDMFGSTWATSM